MTPMVARSSPADGHPIPRSTARQGRHQRAPGGTDSDARACTVPVNWVGFRTLFDPEDQVQPGFPLNRRPVAR